MIGRTGIRELGTGAGRALRRLALAPEYRRLRLVLLIGLLVRLLLAPLTSWGNDTPTFVLSDLGLLYTGSPYSSNLFFNPPLGPILEVPFFALLTQFVPATSLVPLVPAITPVAVTSGLASNLVPTAPALLALKIPLILADVASTLVVYRLVLHRHSRVAADTVAAAWFLNPLLIWVSAVHGEVDGLAALFLVLFVASLERGWPAASGVWLALAVFTKAFPLALLPIGLVFWLAPAGDGEGLKSRTILPLKFVGGLAVVALALLPLLPTYLTALFQSTSSTFYGGMSVLVVYNLAVGRLPGVWGGWEAHSYAPVALLLLRVLAVVGIAASAYALALRRRAAGSRRDLPLETLALFALWAIVAVILSAPSPQSENMVEPLVLLLLAAPAFGRMARPAYLLLSSAAFGLYMSLLGPFAYFYPAAVDFGTPSVRWVNGVVLGYQSGGLGFGPPVLWLVTGLAGGLTVLGIWIKCAHRLFWDTNRRPRGG